MPLSHEQASPLPSSTNKANRKPPLKLRLFLFSIRIFSIVLPNLVALKIYRQWFKTFRHRPHASELGIKQKARTEEITHDNTQLRSYHWPAKSNKKILLVHGWDGRSTQFCAMIEPLQVAGFNVFSIDSPAHGDSEGKQTDLYRMASSLYYFSDRHGPFDAIICHSLGGSVAALAMKNGLSSKRLVCISPPATMLSILQRFADFLAIPQKVLSRIKTLAELEHGFQIWQNISLINNIAAIDSAGLLIHDRYDAEIPYAEAQALSEVWHEAEFHTTEGLGHKKILRDPAVIEKIVKFVSQKNEPELSH